MSVVFPAFTENTKKTTDNLEPIWAPVPRPDLHYIKRQAMLWRNAPAKLAPAETVRAFNAAETRATKAQVLV